MYITKPSWSSDFTDMAHQQSGRLSSNSEYKVNKWSTGWTDQQSISLLGTYTVEGRGMFIVLPSADFMTVWVPPRLWNTSINPAETYTFCPGSRLPSVSFILGILLAAFHPQVLKSHILSMMWSSTCPLNWKDTLSQDIIKSSVFFTSWCGFSFITSTENTYSDHYVVFHLSILCLLYTSDAADES